MQTRFLVAAAGAVTLLAASMGSATAAPGANGLTAALKDSSNIQQAWYGRGYGYGYGGYYRPRYYGYGGYYRRPYYGYGGYYRRPYYGYGGYYRRPYYGYGYYRPYRNW